MVGSGRKSLGKGPRQAKKKPKKKLGADSKQVDAFGESLHNVSEAKSSNTSNKRPKSKKSERSAIGFFCAAAAVAGVFAYSIVRGVQQGRRSKGILSSMRRKPLHITEHAACRMDCRFISKKDIETTLHQGTVNFRKSKPDELPCPKYVVDADLGEPHGRKKKIQAVYSACDHETRLVTAIDRVTNWPCGPC
eukprot:jgi/Picsp_1/3519/NSC_06357-R1_hypothetical protein CHLNCDRAFT_133202 [Chlorella variabilis]